MYPIMLQTRYLTIYSWGLMVALGYLAALLVSMYLARKEDFPAETVMNVYIYTALSAIVGARLFFVLQFIKEYIKRPVEIIMIQRGGFVFLGGFIAAFIVIYIYVRLKRLDIWKVLDIMSPGVMLGYAVGRVGCFLNGCCYGVETDLPWGIKFPAETIFRHPTQLYSAVAGLIIFALLLFIFKRRKFHGQVFLFTVLLYTVYRFSLEFFRYSPIRPAGLTLSQYVAIVFFIMVLFLLWKKKNTTL